MTMSDAVEKFLSGYFSTSNRSMKTQSGYTFDLGQFRDFIGREQTLSSIKPETLEAWAMQMQTRPYAIASIRRKFAAARVFFSYWVRRGALKNSPMWRMRLSLGKEQTLPRSLSPADSQLLIEQAWRNKGSLLSPPLTASGHQVLKIRDIAMVETLFATGIRVGELVKLRLSDWVHEEASFLVRGKGGERALGFSTR